MTPKIQALRERIRRLEEEMEEELLRAKEKLNYTIEERKIRFEKSVMEYHRRLRKSGFRFIMDARLSIVLVSPLIYSMIIPLVALDIFASAYQAVCFPIYGIKKVPRSDFIVLDRHELRYLNVMERLNCLYCSYANGLAAYLRQVAARTESYWCPIKHARRIDDPHSLYDGFEEYGDADGYRERVEKPAGGK